MGKRIAFFIFWLLTTSLFSVFISEGNHTFDAPSTKYVLPALLICTVALIKWLPVPKEDIPTEQNLSRRGWFSLIAIIVIGFLFLARTIIGPNLLYAFPILSVGILVYLRPKFEEKDILYAAALSIIAGLTGLGAGWVSFPPIVWSILQVCLVFTGLLAGWALLRYTGLWQIGISRSQFLDDGIKAAFRSLGYGILISIPWALGIVLIGGAESEQWVQSWWQPFMAINAGIAEEVWGRVLPIPLLFILFRRVFRSKRAYLLALLIMGYWFAYLHTPGGFEGIISTIMIGTLFVLPTTYICFHRDLETAIGFHFFIDFVKFAAAFYLNAGIWFG